MLKVDDLTILRDYLRGVMKRAECHTGVANIVAAVGGNVMVFADDHSLECRTYANHTANILWFTVNGKRYALGYNHNTDKIELTNRNTKAVLGLFDNGTAPGAVLAIFKTL